MARWLVTGATGLLGANALVSLSSGNEVVGLARRAPANDGLPFLAADISSATDRADVVARSGATVVLHSAAIASIEACDRDPQLAHEVNAVASADLAAQARAAGAQFIYISTDAVFDGSRGPYDETDEPSPLSVYGETKLEGECAVLAANPDALVARVNFYGWSPTGSRSLAEFFYNRLSRGEHVTGFTDTIVSTLYVGALADSLVGLTNAGASGIVAVVSSESTSKFDFGRRLASAFGFDETLVSPGRSSDLLAVQRGSNLALRTAKAERILGRPMPTQDESMAALVRSFDAGLRREIAALQPPTESSEQ